MKQMYQTMKEAIVGKLPWIVGAIIVIQPLLDVLSYFLGRWGVILSPPPCVFAC